MTKIINFAELKTPARMSLDIDGVVHEMKNPTIQGFIDGAAYIESIGDAPTPTEEMEAYVKIISEAFPTIGEKNIRNWDMGAAAKVFTTLQSLNGEVVTDDKEEAASGNDQKAD